MKASARRLLTGIMLLSSWMSLYTCEPDERDTSSTPEPSAEGKAGDGVDSAVYQLQNYRNGRLDDLIEGDFQIAIIDLARDAGSDYFTAEEINELRASGKKVLAYFEIGSFENFRPDYKAFRDRNPDVFLNEWPTWPGEYFVKYWDNRWWSSVIRPRVDRALAANFDGVYLDTPLAYEELALELVPGESRESLAPKMVDLIGRISEYAKAQRPGFWVVPQNSPELRHIPGYVDAIDAIGMEELFFLATDKPCAEEWCAENLKNARALRDAGKIVIAIDYASQPENIAEACRRYREEGFVGYVTVLALDTVVRPCSAQK